MSDKFNFLPEKNYPIDNYGGEYIEVTGKIISKEIHDDSSTEYKIEGAAGFEFYAFDNVELQFLPEIGDQATGRIYRCGGGFYRDNRLIGWSGHQKLRNKGLLQELNIYLRFLPLLLEDRWKWKSLLINKYPPIIWRLSYQISPDRTLLLQKIFDDSQSKPYIHSHSWDLAVKIYEGGYLMGLGYSEDRFTVPEITETMLIMPGDSYEILDERIFHYTQIRSNKPSFSAMLIGPRKRPRAAQNNSPLFSWQSEELFNFFQGKI